MKLPRQNFRDFFIYICAQCSQVLLDFLRTKEKNRNVKDIHHAPFSLIIEDENNDYCFITWEINHRW